MTAPESNNAARTRLAIAAAVVLVGAAGLWLMRPGSPETGMDAMPAAERPGAAPGGSTAAPAAAAVVRAPAQRIPDKGRLVVTWGALLEGEVLALGLDMPDDVRGEKPLEVKIVDARGRVLVLEGVPIDGAGTGLRLEIDPEWLRPGVYMVQVKTAEPRPLALRRYVLEVPSSESDTN